jgi:uncharacterized protein (TIGR02118 family)
MHKLVVLYLHPTDQDAFRVYYRDHHLPLFAKMPGLKAMRYSFQLGSAGDQAPYFAIFEADFADAAALAAAMASPEGQAVVADVGNYATGGAIVIDYPITEA